MNKHWRARALIDAGALRHNLELVRKLAPNSRVMAVVKANAYGHGMAAVSRVIADQVDALAVATLDEGIDCRAANPSLPVVVLSGLQHSASLDICRRYQLQPVVHTLPQVAWLEQYGGEALNLWLKIDTGMNRLGIAPEQVADVVARLRHCRGVSNLRLMSHLANADEPDEADSPDNSDNPDDHGTQKQLRMFKQYTDPYPLERSLANSAGVMNCPQTHLHWVRPGIMLYGGSRLPGRGAAQPPLQPVMQLEARLLSVKEIAGGQPVGYGGTFVTAAPMRIGVVGFGYGDGYPRALSPGAEVLLGDVRVRLIGRVSMDMTTVDLSRCPNAVAGDTVVMWGNGLSVDQVASWGATIADELLCAVGARVERIMLRDKHQQS